MLFLLGGIGLGIGACAVPPERQVTEAPPKPPLPVIPPASSPEALEAGARLYQQHCASCHGEKGEGGVGSPMDQTGHAWHHPDNILSWVIVNGTRSVYEMPPFGGVLSPGEIRILIAFLKTFWTPDQLQVQYKRAQCGQEPCPEEIEEAMREALRR